MAIFWVLLLTLFSSVSHASVRNDIPSCYEYAGLSDSLNNKEIERELFIMVDQTALFDTNMKKNVHTQLSNFGKSKDKVTIISFSSMAMGAYMNIEFTGFFESEPMQSVKDNMNAIKLRKLTSCLKNQGQAINKAHLVLKSAFHDEEKRYPRTELVATVLDMGNEIIAKSTAKRKILFLVSDMIENSETLSFYTNKGIQVPDAAASYQKIIAQNFTSNFNGAEAHIIGSGFIKGYQNYISHKSLMELEKFWRLVLTNANAEVKQFGKPNLLSNVY